MEFKRCAVCGKRFCPRPQVPNQTVCAAAECQRERKRRWQQEKRKSDPDYRDNQKRAHKTWVSGNPGYWRDFRAEHPEYTAKNREMQQERNKHRKDKVIAKMDSSPPLLPLSSGTYRITPVTKRGIAKMDSWIVEIRVLARPSDQKRRDCKERT